MDDQLYDKVHAAIVNWLIGAIKAKDPFIGQVYPEYPYNHYGQIGIRE